MEKNLKRILDSYNLSERNKVMQFIVDNPENLDISELSRISEIVNSERLKTAAYYTDYNTLDILEKYLPHIDKKVIRVLEPSAGVGNFIQIIINKYGYADELIIDLNDIDCESIELIKILNEYREIPSNVTINYYNHDFLTHDFKSRYDLVIGNPPFLRLSKNSGLLKYSKLFNDNITRNMAGFFLQKSLKISNNSVLILPKYFLHNSDFSKTRDIAKKYHINAIIDFGENGFKGVLIETVALVINTLKDPDSTLSYSVTKKISNIQKQEKITSGDFPSWIIYRNDFFDDLVSGMEFYIFKSFRDRQITNKVLKSKGDIRVIKSRNINRKGTEIINIKGYDVFIEEEDLEKLSVKKYLNRDDVYLCPNMTYYPRLIKKPDNVVVNGSVAILENISDFEITEDDLKFFSSKTFEEFYRIARNYSTRSLNIDKNSIVFFGLLKKYRD